MKKIKTPSRVRQCRNFVLLLLLAFSLFLSFNSLSVNAETYSRVDDQAELLTADEREALKIRLDNLSKKYETDIVIITVNDIGYLTPTEFVDTYYENKDLGLGPTKSGMLFMLSMAERDWAIATHGEAITIFNDYAQEELMDKILSDLGNNDMNSAFNTLVDYSEEVLANAEKGIYVEESHDYPFYYYLIPPGLALIITLLIMNGLTGATKTIGFQHNANSYLLNDSINLASANDYFLSSSISRVVRSSDNSSSSRSSSSSSRSTTHTSSSGRTFGGSSGKF